jgi:RNase P/RNase MRP subunit p30
MRKAKKDQDIIRVSVTMDRELKHKYARLAVELDLSFSQLVRYALRRVADGVEDLKNLEKRNRNQMKGRDMSM